MKGRKPGSPRVRNIGDGHLTVVSGGGNPPQPPARKNPPPPAWVKDKAARDLWTDLVGELIRRHQYLNLFKVELGRYCNAFADYLRANREIAKTAKQGGGHIVKSPNGYPVQSPWVTIRNRNHEIMLRLAADLGLNPVAQQRLDGVQLNLFDLPAPSAGPEGADPGGGERFARYK